MSLSKSDSPAVGAKAIKFKGSGSHEFMIWLSDWKKYLVYQGVHQIILEGLDSQGKRHEESTDFKVDEIDFFINFWNTDVLKERHEEMKIVKDMISQEFPWIWGYYSEKQITLGVSLWDSIPIDRSSRFWRNSLCTSGRPWRARRQSRTHSWAESSRSCWRCCSSLWSHRRSHVDLRVSAARQEKASTEYWRQQSDLHHSRETLSEPAIQKWWWTSWRSKLWNCKDASLQRPIRAMSYPSDVSMSWPY